MDSDHRTIPNELGLLGSAVHLDKGCYRGQETIARVHNLGRPPRRLVRLHLDGSTDTLPPTGAPLTLDGRAVGFVGGSARHYELGPIALGLVKRNVDPTRDLLAAGPGEDGEPASPRPRRSWSTRRSVCTSAPACDRDCGTASLRQRGRCSSGSSLRQRDRLAAPQSSPAGPFESDPILVEVVRNGTIESVHHGRVAVTGAGRSADPLAGCGVGADVSPQLQQAAAGGRPGPGRPRSARRTCSPWSAPRTPVSRSTSTAVRRILAAAGLSEEDLQTPPDWPADEQATHDLIRAGGEKSSITMNCSGKHAGMLATAALNGWPTATYRDPDHPVQLAILQTIDDLAGEQAGLLAIDGCGAPLFAVSLYGLARSFGRIAAATEGPEARVAEAIRSHPENVSGTRRDELALHRAIPGLVGKAGAEAVYAVGLPDGTGVAIKISDGSPRARPRPWRPRCRSSATTRRPWTSRPRRRCSVTASGWARSARSPRRSPASDRPRASVRVRALPPVTLLA